MPSSIAASIRIPVRLLGTGVYLPEREVGNDEIAARCGVSSEWIVEHLGFTRRRRAEPDQATSDLGAAAATRALESAGLSGSDIDLVVCATCSPDYLFPSTAALIANRIGARGAGAFDLQAGCAGFIHAFLMASQSVALGVSRRALVLGADVISRLVDPTDPSVAPIFGDGAGAVILGPGDSDTGLESIHMGADGGGASLLQLPTGGSRRPASALSFEDGGQALHMEGPALYRNAVRRSGAAARRALTEAGLVAADIDVVIPHQSSRRLLVAIAREANLPLARFVINLDDVGNTACASLPIAMDEAVRTGRLAPGRRALLLGFGAGLSWGAGVLRG